MDRRGRKTERIRAGAGAMGVAACILIGTGATAAASAATKTWSSPGSQSGTNVATASPILRVSPTGQTLEYFENSSSVPAVGVLSTGGTLTDVSEVPPVPGLGNVGTPEQIAFLPDGSAVVTWLESSNSNAMWMAYRSANGVWGAAFNAGPSFISIAARSGEVLGLSGAPNSNTVSVSQIHFSGSGTLTDGTTSTIYSDYLGGWGAGTIALDASGTADALFATENHGIVEARRTANGSWSAAPIAGTSSARAFTAAAAPNGAMIASWQFVASDYSSSQMYAATRQPGGALGPATLIAAPAGGDYGTGTTTVAAGGDGTLAVSYKAQVCTSTSADETTTFGVAVAAPNKALGAVTPVTGDIVDGLGAGDGEASLGVENVQTQGLPSGFDPANCEGNGPSGNAQLTFDWQQYGELISSTGATVSSHELASTVSHNPEQTGDLTATLDASSVDDGGNAAFAGNFTGTGALQASTYGTLGSSAAPPATTPPSPRPTAAKISLSRRGGMLHSMTVTLTGPKTFSDHTDRVSVQLWLTAKSGRSATHLLTKRVRIGLRAHSRSTAKLTLTASAIRYLHAHHIHSVTLTIVSSQAHHRSVTLTRTVHI